MSGAGSDKLHVTSWGWCDDDGKPALADVATFRVWRVRSEGDLVGLLSLPVDMGSMEALTIAAAGFLPE